MMIIRQAQTQGMRYQVQLEQCTASLYDIVTLTHGRIQGRCCNIPSLAMANAKFDQLVADAAQIDGINYHEH